MFIENIFVILEELTSLMRINIRAIGQEAIKERSRDDYLWMIILGIQNHMKESDGSTCISSILLHKKYVWWDCFLIQTFTLRLFECLLNGSLLIEEENANSWLRNHFQSPFFSRKHFCESKLVQFKSHLFDVGIDDLRIRFQRHPILVLSSHCPNKRIINKSFISSHILSFLSFLKTLPSSRLVKISQFKSVKHLHSYKYYISIFRRIMQVRSILRNNTMTSLNKKTTTKATKPVKLKGDDDKQNDSGRQQLSIFYKHPAFQYIRATSPTPLQYKKFVTLLYKGLFYSINNLKGPSQEYINKKKVKLPEPTDSKKKFLILDLDQTLIHSVFTSEKTDVKFTCKGDEFKFNVRPYCMEFLSNMSQYFNVYVFTAGTLDYAEPIINYLNQKKKTILGFLHRKNCMETQNGFFIKDLRIIQNRDLKDIIMVDNLVHSFGLQITNGIPILEYLEGKSDKELQGLERMLIDLSTKDDVREHLENKLRLKDILEIDENNFLSIDDYTQQKL